MPRSPRILAAILAAADGDRVDPRRADRARPLGQPVRVGARGTPRLVQQQEREQPARRVEHARVVEQHAPERRVAHHDLGEEHAAPARAAAAGAK